MAAQSFVGGSKLDETLSAPLQGGETESRGMRNRRNDVMIVVPSVALKIAMNQVSAKPVVLLLAVVLAGVHGGSSLDEL